MRAAGQRPASERSTALPSSNPVRHVTGLPALGDIRHLYLPRACAGFHALVVPADDDPSAFHPSQRPGLRLSCDRVALARRKRLPWLHRQHRVRTSPDPGDLPIDQQAAWPDSRRPDRGPAIGVRNHELAIGSVQEQEGIPAGQQPGWAGCRRSGRRPRSGLVLSEDPRLADRCPHKAIKTDWTSFQHRLNLACKQACRMGVRIRARATDRGKSGSSEDFVVRGERPLIGERSRADRGALSAPAGNLPCPGKSAPAI
jgi:hypothetical protein